MLLTPGHSPERMSKALTLPVDSIAFDLEDGVALARKPEARAHIARALTESAFGRRERVVRINALDTDLWRADLDALPLDRADALLVPKVERPEMLRALDDRLDGTGCALILTIETPRGVFNALPIADASPRCIGLFFGPGDYTMATGGALTPASLHWPRSVIAAAAGAVGAQAIDAPYLIGIKDADGTRRDALLARELGFAGKMVFHPSQIGPVNAAFSPTDAEVARAERIVRGYADAMARGEATAYVDGEFVAIDLVPRMQRLLDIARTVRDAA